MRTRAVIERSDYRAFQAEKEQQVQRPQGRKQLGLAWHVQGQMELLQITWNKVDKR